MHARRVIAAALLAATSWHAPSALADPEPGQDSDLRGWTDSVGVGAEALLRSRTPPRPRVRRAVRAQPCRSLNVPDEASLYIEHFYYLGLTGLPRGAEPGRWVLRSCPTAEGAETSTVRWAVQPPPRSQTVALARRALGYAPLQLPVIGVSPAPDLDQLVNVITWLWIDPAAWVPTSTSASTGGITVTTTATPTRVVWDTGDAVQVVCDGPGTPYDPRRPDAIPTCSHTYRRPAEQVVLTATVEWSVSWTATSGEGGDLGVVRRSTSVPLRVAEVQAVNAQP